MPGISITNPYHSISGSSEREVDMRGELIKTLEGSDIEIAKAHKILLRKFRLDGNKKKILCPCVSPLTLEADEDSYCPISINEKHLWDEQLIATYSVYEAVPPELPNNPLIVFYMRYDTSVTKDDKLVEVALDLEGNLASPLKRTQLYKIRELLPLRADRGRVEYIKAACTREDIKYLNAPLISD
jgi:hypothetical protein